MSFVARIPDPNLIGTLEYWPWRAKQINVDTWKFLDPRPRSAMIVLVSFSFSFLSKTSNTDEGSSARRASTPTSS